MKLDQYISQLLYRYQCVTVPEFGAFLTEIQSAQLHESSHSFYPPKKLVSFNAYLKNNDGLLANHIAQAEKMSYEVAVTVIQNEVNSLKHKLQNEGVISLKNIGELTLNSEKNLVFIPADQVNYLTSSFGLSTYSSPAVKREIFTEEIEIVEEEAPIAFVPEKRSTSNLLKYAAVFVLGGSLLGAGGFFGNQYYQKQIQAETLAVQTKVQKQVERKIQEATFFIANPLPSVTLTVSESKMPYHIVAGAFLQEDNAEKMYQELVKLGYNAKKITKNKHGLFPVLYGSFATYSEAQTEMERIKKSHNPEAWLLIEEL
ncbi:SPOR domain-containing protein [Flavobacterium sp. SUN052]|uniref:HU domain-containing protein n=1 Tax=Flavobacterium sp. SUN052 TaxID=3002441 RepID=UPI00237DE3A0|nr:SPOR domain-containing protein [Flavobacterium sp. SUN052]MEC4003461.1 SPOR domain-containing protein [Flavobacterium sp. SUN052]